MRHCLPASLALCTGLTYLNLGPPGDMTLHIRDASAVVQEMRQLRALHVKRVTAAARELLSRELPQLRVHAQVRGQEPVKRRCPRVPPY